MSAINFLEKVKIIFEDEDFLAIDKPSGLVVHADGRTEEESLVDWVKSFSEKNNLNLENIGNPHTLDSGRYASRWGVVNRLDRETSGVILIAKTNTSFENLQKQFSERKIEKEYLAVCWGAAERRPLSGKITEPLSRHKKDPRIWVLQNEEGARNTGRDAETDYEIVKGKDNFLLIKFWPKTGRTHQIRLHAKFLGTPILGDKKYGVGGIDNPKKEDLENRLMLHAKSLKFLHPTTGEEIIIESELPEEFKDF